LPNEICLLVLNGLNPLNKMIMIDFNQKINEINSKEDFVDFVQLLISNNIWDKKDSAIEKTKKRMISYKRKVIIIFILCDILAVLLTIFKLWTLGETRTNAYIFASILTFLGLPISLCIGFFICYIIYSIAGFIKRLRDR
jgi:hypothetical protein